MTIVLGTCNRPAVVTFATVVSIPDPASLLGATGLVGATRIYGRSVLLVKWETDGDTVIIVPSSQP